MLRNKSPELVLTALFVLISVAEAQTKLSVSLRDGNRLEGMAEPKTLKLDISAAGNLSVKSVEFLLEKTSEISFPEQGPVWRATVRFTNGDQLSGKLVDAEETELKSIELTTEKTDVKTTKVTVPVANIKMIRKQPLGDPLAYYPFDRDFNDYGGTERPKHGVARGSVKLQPGRFGNAVSFHDAKSNIDLAHHDGFAVDTRNGNVTVAAWVKATSGTVFSDNTRTGWYYLWIDDGIVKLGYVHSDWSEISYVASVRRIDDDRFHHIVGIMDGLSLSLYLDGELEEYGDFSAIRRLHWSGTIGHCVCSEEDLGTVGACRCTYSTSGVSIGSVGFKTKEGCPSSTEFRSHGRFDGLIDEVRIFDRAIFAEEVQALYRMIPVQESKESNPV